MLPKQTNMYLPILKILEDSNKTHVPIREICHKLADQYYDKITLIDRLTLTKTGAPWWLNRGRYTRKKMEGDGLIEIGTKGIRITPDGKGYLERHWHEWEPEYSENTLPRGVKVREVMEEDLTLSSEPLTDRELLSQLGNLAKEVRDSLPFVSPDPHKKDLERVAAGLEELAEEVNDRLED